LAPELCTAILAVGTENCVPGVELGERDTSSAGEGGAGSPVICHQVLGAAGDDTALCRTRSCDGSRCAGRRNTRLGHADAVVLLSPELRATILAVGTEDAVPSIQLRERDPCSASKCSTGIPIVRH
jgi:hypothetical protein